MHQNVSTLRVNINACVLIKLVVKYVNLLSRTIEQNELFEYLTTTLSSFNCLQFVDFNL